MIKINSKYLSMYYKYVNKYLKIYGTPSSVNDRKPNLHIHHITPKQDGGTDEIINLVYVSPREHLMLHWTRWKAFGSQTDWNMVDMWRKFSKKKIVSTKKNKNQQE